MNRALGYWVTLKEVPGIGHAYAPGARKQLIPWIAELARGAKPADPMAAARAKDREDRDATAARILQTIRATLATTTRPATQQSFVLGNSGYKLETTSRWAFAAARRPLLLSL